MSEIAASFGPMVAFMLIPLWIPLLAIVGGWLWEVLVRPAPSPVAARLDRLRGERAVERLAQAEMPAVIEAPDEVALPEAA